MSCAACQARVEKAVSKVPGVESCSVSLLTNSMGVEGSAAAEDIIAAIEKAGYGAELKGAKAIGDSGIEGEGSDGSPDDGLSVGVISGLYVAEEEALRDRETPILKKRLVTSLGFLIVLMYLSMGHMMWGWPIPGFMEKNHMLVGVIQMVLAAAVMVINKKFFTSGFRGLFHGAPNMDTLVALGSAASFGWSIYVLFATGNMHDLYFESAAMILTLITVGKMLEARSKGKTTDALKSLMKLAPETATVLHDGIEVEIPIAELKVDDVFVVRPGSSIPVDGIIIEGASAVNESALTGESIPVDKAVGDRVSAATISESGYLKCRATHVGEDTTLSKIIKMVSDAAATKAPIAKIADKVSGIFVPVVIGIALVTLIIWLLVGQTAGYSLARAISVLVISCPCALGLATPVAIMVGNGVGAKNGMLFKTAVSLEETGRTDVVVLDKTGTITMGEPRVTDVIPTDGVDPEELIIAAYSIERKSEHPLAKAIVAAVEGDKNRESLFEAKAAYAIKKHVSADEFEVLPGNGLCGVLQDDSDYAKQSRFKGYKISGGKAEFINEIAAIGDKMKEQSEKLAEEGKTCLYFAADDRLLGLIAVADTIKEDSPQAVRELQNMGIKVVMLTGDNEKTAKAIGTQAGVDEVIAGVLPDGKEEAIRNLQNGSNAEGVNNYKVAMVGDGINDAPALTRADIGIAIGAGADVAIDAADVVLMNSKLTDVSAAVRLSRATLKNIHQNLFWAFFYNVIGIPIAAGAFIKAFGLELNPMLGAAAMSLSSFFVVTNALRLNLFDVHNASSDKPKKSSGETADSIDNEGANGIASEEAETIVIEESSGDMTVIESTDRTDTDKHTNDNGGTEMKRTIKIEGMMCMHCEATVKKALEEIEGVESAEVSHEAGTAIVTATDRVPDEMLKKAVEDKEYTVLGIESDAEE